MQWQLYRVAPPRPRENTQKEQTWKSLPSYLPLPLRLRLWPLEWESVARAHWMMETLTWGAAGQHWYVGCCWVLVGWGWRGDMDWVLVKRAEG